MCHDHQTFLPDGIVLGRESEKRQGLESSR